MNDKKSDNKSPGFWFYPNDYERDVQMLSLSAQGLWMRMLCWMHSNEMHRGFLELPTGDPMTNDDISSRSGKPLKEVEKALFEMRRIGIYSVDDRGAIFCRRMAREDHISKVRRDAAMSRLQRSVRSSSGAFAPSLPDVCSSDAGDFAGAKPSSKSQQNPAVSASVSVSVSDSSITHTQGACALQTEPAKISPIRRPIAADLAGPPTSTKFEEFWNRYPRKQRRDSAAAQWISFVTAASEGAVFACLARYLASDEVARGVIANPDKWLYEQHRNSWEGDWPRAPDSGYRKTRQQEQADAWKDA